ncbi:hypothetical protein [Parasitella parasitica]|uniref:Uncharacterized protein n=1 Tax=Parasitella parasitica TaxID=35722 RepID=A0A0B7N532_9FUNG|nr:hypothetical protein [Parasitella parasitica]
MEAEILALLLNHAIEETSGSGFQSHVFTVPKKDGVLRPVCLPVEPYASSSRLCATTRCTAFGSFLRLEVEASNLGQADEGGVAVGSPAENEAISVLGRLYTKHQNQVAGISIAAPTPREASISGPISQQAEVLARSVPGNSTLGLYHELQANDPFRSIVQAPGSATRDLSLTAPADDSRLSLINLIPR